MKISLNPLAEVELVEGARYYATHANRVVADSFISEFERAATLLAQNPGLGTPLRGRLSAFPLHRFPYSIIFTVRDSELRVLAIAHHRRRPGYWARRS